jgi:hypothetical protein
MLEFLGQIFVVKVRVVFAHKPRSFGDPELVEIRCKAAINGIIEEIFVGEDEEL